MISKRSRGKVVKRPRKGKEDYKEERKFVDTDGNIANSATLGSEGFKWGATDPVMHLVQTCKPGSGNYQRIGNRIRNKSLQIVFNAFLEGSIGTLVAPMGILKCSVVYDTRPSKDGSGNGVYPDISDIYRGVSNTGTVLTALNAAQVGFNVANQDRFKILASKSYEIPPYNAGNAAFSLFNTGGFPIFKTVHSMYVKLRDLETVFNNTSASGDGLLGDIQSGAIYVVWQNPWPSENFGINLQYFYRWSFVDF